MEQDHTTPPHSLSPQLALLVASLSALLGSLDSSVNIAFPAISAAFDLDVSLMQWVVVSYVLTYASLLLGCGRLADLWGHSRMLSWGLAGSAVAFLCCGIAPTFSWFLVARIGQGIAVAFLFASAPALVTLTAPAERRGQALGLFQMSAAIGFALGPLLGGLLVDMFGWRAVYLFRIPLALVLMALAVYRPLFHAAQRERQQFDLVGALTLAGSVAGLLLAFSRGRDLGWTSPLVLMLVGGSTLSFAGFIITERRVAAPIVDLSLFRHPAFFIANALNVLANGSMFAIWLLVPYYLVNALEYPATTGGFLLTATPLATALAAPLAGKLADRLGTSALSSMGLGLEALGLWSISQLDTSSSALTVVLVLGCVGLGLGLFQTPNMSFVMGAISREQQGVAGGMSQMMRTLGVVLGVTSASMLFSNRRAVYTEQLHLPTANTLQSFLPAFQEVFLVSSVICLAAFGLSLLRGKFRS